LLGSSLSLSVIYHDKNVATLINIATLGLTMDDTALAQKSINILKGFGHSSPEASLLEYLVAQRLGDRDKMHYVQLFMRASWPESKQYQFTSNGEDFFS
jgi:Tfp pilus assembly protein PilF